MHEHAGTKARFAALTIGSVGVVYGDIGTSPLYAFREALVAATGKGPILEETVLGVLSLILWSLILVVTLKYVVLLLRADNNGEGGTLSLMALAFRGLNRHATPVVILGMVGAAMFYGSSFITPALSVMSAIEGLKVVTPAFEKMIVPLTLIVLIALFAVQTRGTGRIAILFAPIMVLWFVVIAAAGVVQIVHQPGVLAAVNPFHAVDFLIHHSGVGLVTLGFVLLAVTGGEALYADLGHFGRRPIQAAWFGLVLPALTLNYFGQGALMLADPDAIANPFYRMVPDPMLVPMVVLATAATAIASQAVITGSYSITRQAIQLGLLPRLEVQHKSGEQEGQIFMPRVNVILLAGVVVLVAVFKTSSALAAAYGLAVAAAMMVDSLLAFVVIRTAWRWPLWATAVVVTPLALVDATFVTATLMNIFAGAWVPVAIAALILVLMVTWRRGTAHLEVKTRRIEVPLSTLINRLEKHPPLIVSGLAVYLTSQSDLAPAALLHNLKHNRMLHESNLILSVKTEDIPQVAEADRVTITELSPRFRLVQLRFGFMESPNVPRAMGVARKSGLKFDIMSTSFFLSRRSLKAANDHKRPYWQDQLFIELSRQADDASNYFQIPTGRVVEVGAQITI
ncbi:potassium transporter Kup [Xanthobacteraceae bacterium Astr-EGSB]|uniref:potassium transporter Kup n=1 Tax=Astrobacterium formosum TaxID=3069710 RepID=UPI0027B02DB2|nr:potassium transporter Kup [Xanthobacteraceae bacterium Astr-EGSB]